MLVHFAYCQAATALAFLSSLCAFAVAPLPFMRVSDGEVHDWLEKARGLCVGRRAQYLVVLLGLDAAEQ